MSKYEDNMEVEAHTIKIVNNEESVNVITKESYYYAKGIKNVRRLKGKKITREFLVI